MAWILKEFEYGECLAELVQSASRLSDQLSLFSVGLSGMDTSSWLTEGTFVPEGCALTHSRGEAAVLRKSRGFIGRLDEIG